MGTVKGVSSTVRVINTGSICGFRIRRRTNLAGSRKQRFKRTLMAPPSSRRRWTASGPAGPTAGCAATRADDWCAGTRRTATAPDAHIAAPTGGSMPMRCCQKDPACPAALALVRQCRIQPGLARGRAELVERYVGERNKRPAPRSPTSLWLRTRVRSGGEANTNRWTWEPRRTAPVAAHYDVDTALRTCGRRRGHVRRSSPLSSLSSLAQDQRKRGALPDLNLPALVFV